MINNNQTRLKENKKPLISKKLLILLLSFLTILTIFISISLSNTVENIIEPIQKYNRELNNLKLRVDTLRKEYTSLVDTETNCESNPQQEETLHAIGVDIAYYSKSNDPIEIPSICKNCIIREVGNVIYKESLPPEFKELKLIRVRTGNENLNVTPDTISPTYSYENRDMYTFLINQDYSEVYIDSELLYYMNEDPETISPNLNTDIKFNSKYSFFISENSTPEKIQKFQQIKSEKGLFYKYGFFTGFTLSEYKEYVNLEPFDSYNNKIIYVDNDNPNNYYIEDIDFYIIFLEFYPSICYFAGNDEILPILWNSNIINIYRYYYGYNERSGEDYFLESTVIPKEELEITGYTITKQPIYEFKDKQRKELKNIYNNYEKNNLEENPMSYQEFTNNHPLIFWEDETGRIIEFKNLFFYLPEGWD